jgi:hypothetical protein
VILSFFGMGHSQVVVGLVLETAAFDSVLHYFGVHLGFLQHEVADVGVEGVLGVGIGQDEDEPAEDHS